MSPSDYTVQTHTSVHVPSGALILFPFTKIVQLNSHRSYYMTGLNKSIIHSSKVLFKVSDSVFQPY